MKNCEYLRKGISSPLMLGGRYTQWQWSCYIWIQNLKNVNVNASGLLWQRSGQPVVLVARESKLCSGESKASKSLTIVCVQPVTVSDLF